MASGSSVGVKRSHGDADLAPVFPRAVGDDAFAPKDFENAIAEQVVLVTIDLKVVCFRCDLFCGGLFCN